MKKIFYFISAIIIFFQACKSSNEMIKKENPAGLKPALDCSSKGLTYASIKSIIESNCIRCHRDGGTGGYDFTIFEDIKKAATKGALLGSIKHQYGFSQMPAMAKKLDPASIDQIECWINNGMKK